MADPVTTTVSPKAEPILDPPVALLKQYVKPWGPAYMRPPLKDDGTQVAGESEIVGDAVIKAAHGDTWQASACHPTAFAMVVKWYLEANPKTKGQLTVPNRTDAEAALAVDPLLVTKWLWDSAGNPAQVHFVSDTDRPPFVPHKLDASGKGWNVDHAKIFSSASQITLNGDGMKSEARGLLALTPNAFPGYKAQRAKLQKDLAQANSAIADNEAKQQGASDKQQASLQKAHDKLVAKRDGIQAKLDANPAEDDGSPNPDRVARARTAKKEALKRALLKGPVLLNMTFSGHYVLLYGYRDRKMYICDPGHIIANKWVKVQTDKSAAGIVSEGGDILVIDAESTFTLPTPGSKTGETFDATYLDCLINFESYFFAALGEQGDWNDTPEPASKPFPEK